MFSFFLSAFLRKNNTLENDYTNALVYLYRLVYKTGDIYPGHGICLHELAPGIFG